MKTSFKGLLLVLLVFVLALSLVACNDPIVDIVDPNDPAVVAENETPTAGTTAAIQFKNGDITIKTVTVTKGTALTEEQIPEGPQIAGKTFTGWYIGGAKVEAGYVVNEAVSATAQYTVTPVVTTVTVTFKTSDDDETPIVVEVNEGETIAAADIPADPTAPAGQHFVAWKTAEGVAFDATAVVTEDVIYIAEFADTICTVTFKTSAEDENPVVVEVYEGETIDADDIPADPTPAAGYRFVAWKTAAGVAFDATAAVTADATYIANFEQIPVYTLTFKTSAEDENPTTVEVYEGATIDADDIPADPTAPAGQRFVAWKTAAGVAFDATAVVTADATYIAEFINVYTLTFKTSAEDENPVVIEIDEGETIDADDIPADPTAPAGQHFVAWKTAAGVAFDATAAVTANATYIAEFEDTIYTLTFKTSAEDENPTIVQVKEGEVPAASDLPADPEPADGYYFVAWKTAGGDAFDATAAVTADATYVAEFAEDIAGVEEGPDDTLPDDFDSIPAVFVGTWNGTFGENITVTITESGAVSGAPVALEVIGISATTLTLQSDTDIYVLTVIDDTTLRLTEDSSGASSDFTKV